MSLPDVVSRQQWLQARRRLLAQEKELTRKHVGNAYAFLDMTALGRQEGWEEPKLASD
jgi:predicted dithiol-disulfide oxidoreductase (DUF899 family)